MTYKIRLSDEQKRILERLADPGKAPALIRAVQSGTNIIISGTGNDADEYLLLNYLRGIGANVTDGRSSLIVQFTTPRHGLGGMRQARTYRNIRADQA